MADGSARPRTTHGPRQVETRSPKWDQHELSASGIDGALDGEGGQVAAIGHEIAHFICPAGMCPIRACDTRLDHSADGDYTACSRGQPALKRSWRQRKAVVRMPGRRGRDHIPISVACTRVRARWRYLP